MERIAPIQINYLGYPGTLGSNCIDYILADKMIIPNKLKILYRKSFIFTKLLSTKYK